MTTSQEMASRKGCKDFKHRSRQRISFLNMIPMDNSGFFMVFQNNILIQSAQAMLAQANQVPQGVLQLLQSTENQSGYLRIFLPPPGSRP